MAHSTLDGFWCIDHFHHRVVPLDNKIFVDDENAVLGAFLEVVELVFDLSWFAKRRGDFSRSYTDNTVNAPVCPTQGLHMQVEDHVPVLDGQITFFSRESLTENLVQGRGP